MDNCTEGKTEETDQSNIGTALVVGAGVAGIRAALDLAEVGYRVLLTDASPAIGGILAKLDYQFPSDHCGMCKMLPMVGREYASQYCMRKSLFHDNIKIMPFTEVTGIKGEAGAYSVDLLRRARHVDTDICIGTGLCADVCPIEVPDEFNQGLATRKAIFRPVPHNLPNMYLIDMKSCDSCGECVKVCPVDAINLEAQDEVSTVEVDTLILAAGSGLYNPSISGDLSSYSISDDVVTSLDFERLLSASGGYDGMIRRPSDGKQAKRIAWLQCVGSRNRRQGQDYCSSICCMFALKEAVLAHEKGGPETETTLFYMDMRTFGKDFYRYREQAEEKHGVKLVRCRVHTAIALEDGSLQIRYQDPKTGEWHLQDFDMVVLSTGQKPPSASKQLGDLLGVEPSETGFFQSAGVEKVKSPRDGVFMCGSFTGLTDISESLISGSAAAGEASKLMTTLGKEFKADVTLPPERPVARQRPLVHVLLCRWNHGKMPEGIDLEPLQEELIKEAGVGAVHIIDTLCRGAGLEEAEARLKESKCNRVLFGACLPYIYRQRLKIVAQKAGFTSSLVEVTDLRSIIQRYLVEKDVSALMRTVRQRIQVSLQKLKASDVVPSHSIPIIQQALVIGGGIAGMRASLSLAQRGIEVHLVERSESLGGRPLKQLHYTLDGVDPAQLVGEIRQSVYENNSVTVHLRSEVIRNKGTLGRFESVIKNGEGKEIVVLHGATIITTGGHEAVTTEYHHDESELIATQANVEHQLATGELDASTLDTVVMIQCVGSREKGAHEYCSRVCCSAALKNAFKMREKNPDVRIIILYRDMMTYGFLEQYYTRARGEGIIFATYDLDGKPQVELVDGKPKITFTDQILREQVEVTADLLCLSTGIEASPSNEQVAEIMGVELTPDGFFQEAESKWRPVDFLKEGVFLAGTAHSPGPISEVISQAEAAAQRAFTTLSRRSLTTARLTSSVHDSLCSRCQTCVTICPYYARSYDPVHDRIVVDDAACQACGMCAVACPNSAAEVMGMGEEQTMAIIEASMQDAWSSLTND